MRCLAQSSRILTSLSPLRLRYDLPSDAQRQVVPTDNPSLLLHVMTFQGHDRHLTKFDLLGVIVLKGKRSSFGPVLFFLPPPGGWKARTVPACLSIYLFTGGQ